MPELPTGTVTFLFTDVEGSTRLWEERPDAMRDALARHDAILRDGVTAHEGYVVKSTGDGIHAVFATAHDALDAAVAMQRGLALESFDEMGPLRVRMGVHTCEVKLVVPCKVHPGNPSGQFNRTPPGVNAMDNVGNVAFVEYVVTNRFMAVGPNCGCNNKPPPRSSPRQPGAPVTEP